MFVKPAAGLSVPDPERGGLLAAEGREVQPTTYWHKRLGDKDVEQISKEDHEKLVADKAEADKAAATAAAAEAPAAAVQTPALPDPAASKKK